MSETRHVVYRGSAPVARIGGREFPRHGLPQAVPADEADLLKEAEPGVWDVVEERAPVSTFGSGGPPGLTARGTPSGASGDPELSAA